MDVKKHIFTHMNKISKRISKETASRERSRIKGLKVKWLRMFKGVKSGMAMASAALALMLVSCDGHQDFPDTSMKIGHVVCTDGQVMDYDNAVSLGKEPIAVVYHINNDSDVQGRGLAVYLHEMPQYALTDSLGVAQGTSSDYSALDGNANTFAMIANTTVNSPAAQALLDMWKYGQSAYIPSVAELRLLFQSKQVVNPVIEKCGGEAITDDSANGWVWTSTEVAGQETFKAWLYSLASGAAQETPKDQAHKLRPIITIND